MKKSIIDVFSKNLKNVDINEINKIKIDLRKLTIENIIYISKKSPTQRTNEEIAFLKNFGLFKTKFAEKLTKENIEDQTQEIIMLLSMLNSNYKLIKDKDEIIYDLNEEAKYFYVILYGNVEVYSIEKIDCEINGEVADWVQNCASIQMHFHDFYGNGRNLPQDASVAGNTILNYSISY